MQQDKALIETMRQDLDRERLAHEAAERSLHETRAILVHLQTRLAHVEMDLQAAKEAVQEAAEQQALARAPLAVAAPAPVRRKPRAEKAEREPQPVKWWVKTEKS